MLRNYSKFHDEMILRDYLALDRTVLANERTLLAHVRTFIGALSAGIGIIKLVGTPITVVVGYILVISSPLFLIFGTIHYVKVSRKLNTIIKNTGEDGDGT